MDPYQLTNQGKNDNENTASFQHSSEQWLVPTSTTTRMTLRDWNSMLSIRYLMTAGTRQTPIIWWEPKTLRRRKCPYCWGSGNLFLLQRFHQILNIQGVPKKSGISVQRSFLALKWPKTTANTNNSSCFGFGFARSYRRKRHCLRVVRQTGNIGCYGGVLNIRSSFLDGKILFC